MKYCFKTTSSHPLSVKFPVHLENINDIIKSEGGSHCPFGNEVALNLDKVKKNSEDAEIKRMKSMDMFFGLNDGTNVSSLLVDFKLDCKNPVNISEKDCRGKIKDSRVLLFGGGVRVHNKYVFVFNDSLLQVSRRIISLRLANAYVETLSVNELKSNYF